MKLWVDDIRRPPDGTWIWVSHPDIAIWHLINYSVSEMSLDHDLGVGATEDCKEYDITTRPIVLWLCEHEHDWPEFVHVHSMNPVGKRWLLDMVDRYKPT